MAFANLNPFAAIWRSRGLRYLLMPCDVADPAAPQAPPVPPPQTASARPPFRRPGAEPPQEVTEARQPEKKTLAWRPLSPQEWPQGWRDLLARAKKGRIAWTYASLGDDLLAGRSNDDADARSGRSRFLRRVLRDLRHPAGTHTFWPAVLAGEVQADVFWSGLKELGCRGTIIMGPDLANALTCRTGLGPWRQINHRGQFVWILPAIDGFPENEYTRMLDSLRRALAMFIERP